MRFMDIVASIFGLKINVLYRLDGKTRKQVLYKLSNGESCKVKYNGKNYLFVPHKDYRCIEV